MKMRLQSSSFLSGPSLSKQGMPFIDNELIKSYLIERAKEICPEKINMFKTISISSITWRTEDCGRNISSQLKNKAHDIEWFTLFLDELIAVTNSAQLFIWEVNTKFEVAEESASMNSPHGTTRGESIVKEVDKTNKYNLKWNLLGCVITAGGKK